MKRLLGWLAVAVVMVMAAWFVGCREREEKNRETPDVPLDVQIMLAYDTVYVLAGDSAITYGFVTVRDENWHSRQGLRVEMRTNSSLSRVQFSNSLSIDTTNEDGEVEFFCFAAAAQFRWDTVIATSRNNSGVEFLGYAAFLVRGPQPSLPFFHIWAYPETLYADSTHCDSTLISVSVADSSYQGIPGFHVAIRSSCEARLGSTPVTDEHGYARCWAYLCEVGQCWFYALGDSVLITVLPRNRNG